MMSMLRLLLYGIGIGLASKVVDYSFRSRGSRPLKLLSRIFTIVIFVVALVGLGFYSIVAVDEGAVKRIIAGALTLALLFYFAHILTQYRKDS